MFEQQYDDEMTAEIKRLEGNRRAGAVGHPEWDNACGECGCRLPVGPELCDRCAAL
ncbi:MAG TPA: hypothetical protein VFF53_13120 [Geobacteraceae bacterium]|nr:hypothetical protein [Geobacteraceae bacterium]